MMSYQELLINAYIQQYASNWFMVNEGSGTSLNDNKGNALGIAHNSSWDSNEALIFNGTSSYLTINKGFSSGEISFTLEISTKQNTLCRLLNSASLTTQRGIACYMLPNGTIGVSLGIGTSGSFVNVIESNISINDGNKHIIKYCWDGKIGTNNIKLYIDDMITPHRVISATYANVNPTFNSMVFGRNVESSLYYFNGKLYNIALFDKDISKLNLNKSFILNDGEYKNWNSLNGWSTVSTTTPTAQEFLTNGMDNDTIVASEFNSFISDFEIVTWTDKSGDNVIRKLSVESIPEPQVIYSLAIQDISGKIQSISTNDLSTNPSNVRYLFTSDNIQWRYYNSITSRFEIVTPQDYKLLGNTFNNLNSIDFTKWTDAKFNVGIYLEDSIDGTQTSHVERLGVNYSLPNKTSTLSNINFYILNTTARIDLELAGLTLTGSLSDADLTRVQYKVTLNGKPFFPINGEFTALSEPPQNINITMKTSDIKMMDWNTLRVDFKDYFGTEDYWQTTFVGNYASLMFKDVDGNYYSDDVGEVLQYLDFGNIVAGEVTVSHEIILKNQYGYAVKDIEIVPNTSYLPEGVSIEMSKTNDPFIPESDLLYTEGLADNEELSFFVRMNTDVNSIPNEHNKFDVFVKASRKDV